MLRNTIKTIVAIALITGLTTCTTGPQVQKPVDGIYNGALSGTPLAVITLNVNDGKITGTGSIKANDPIFRTAGAENDIVITGTNKNAQITTMTATMSFEYNTTPGTPTPTWVAGTGQISFYNGEFTKNGGALGAFGGTTTIANLNLGGSWIATKSSVGAGILKP